MSDIGSWSFRPNSKEELQEAGIRIKLNSECGGGGSWGEGGGLQDLCLTTNNVCLGKCV